MLTKAQYTRCDLVAYDLVTSYGIDSSSILYDTLYATYDHTICNAHIVIYRLYVTKSYRVYWA